jgi:shikimate dehydrogenase
MPDRYAVIGNPIAHSKSPALHTAFARQCAQDIVYEAIYGPLDRFAECVMSFRASGGRGMNVTMPFKLEAFSIADDLTERARLAEAVNTLIFENGRILGDNTDGVGLVRDLQENLGITLQGKSILIMGAGGAARGVLRPLLDENPSRLVIANNTPSKAVALKEQVVDRAQVDAGGFADFADERFDVIINATAASLSGETVPLSRGMFAEGALAYDMAYGTGNTPFMEAALVCGPISCR